MARDLSPPSPPVWAGRLHRTTGVSRPSASYPICLALHLFFLLLLYSAALHPASALDRHPRPSTLSQRIVRLARLSHALQGRHAFDPSGSGGSSDTSVDNMKLSPGAAFQSADVAAAAASGWGSAAAVSSAEDAVAGGGTQQAARRRAPTAKKPPPPPPRRGPGDVSRYFTVDEISRPIPRPPRVQPCRVTLMTNQNFSGGVAYRWYTPPDATTCGRTWRLIIVRTEYSIRGRQFDRTFELNFDGLEIIRSTTAQDVALGTKYSVERDITAYASFLRQRRRVEAKMFTVVNDIYTGIYYINVTLLFFPGQPAASADLPDLVLPAYPKPLPQLPRNIVRAKLEIMPHHYILDEFYYTNIPDKLYNQIPANQRRGLNPGGAFREIVLKLDGRIAGAVHPFPILYSGAFQPLLWAPLLGIGALHTPVYFLDVTPFVGLLANRGLHRVNVSLPYSDPKKALWTVTVTLHLWLNKKSAAPTRGQLIRYQVPPNSVLEEKVTVTRNLDNVIVRLVADTQASRRYTIVGTAQIPGVGNITTNVTAVMSTRNNHTFARTEDLQHTATMTTTTQSYLVPAPTATASHVLPGGRSLRGWRAAGGGGVVETGAEQQWSAGHSRGGSSRGGSVWDDEGKRRERRRLLSPLLRTLIRSETNSYRFPLVLRLSSAEYPDSNSTTLLFIRREFNQLATNTNPPTTLRLANVQQHDSEIPSSQNMPLIIAHSQNYSSRASEGQSLSCYRRQFRTLLSPFGLDFLVNDVQNTC